MLEGAPEGTIGGTNLSNEDLFYMLFKYFIKFSCPSKDNPGILIMDTHESHIPIKKKMRNTGNISPTY